MISEIGLLILGDEDKFPLLTTHAEMAFEWFFLLVSVINIFLRISLILFV